MSYRTKIVVLHMKEIIYTIVFAILAILLVLLLVFMFAPKNNDTKTNEQKYIPGIYTSTVTLNTTALEVEVTVDESHINSIRFSNLNDTITTMYPLIQPTIEDIAEQVYQTQSLENIEYNDDNPYTSQIIVNAIREELEKAETTEQLRLFFSKILFSVQNFLILLRSDTFHPEVQILLMPLPSLLRTFHLHPFPLLPGIL